MLAFPLLLWIAAIAIDVVSATPRVGSSCYLIDIVVFFGTFFQMPCECADGPAQALIR
jgi:hypothetical protein